MFGLFNRPYRKVKKDQLINSVNRKGTLVEVEFEANGREYMVRRGIRPGIFEVYASGTLLNQNAKSRDYQKILEKQILGLDHRSFRQIVVLGSATFTPFMSLGTNDRRHIIEDLLGMSVFSVMADVLKHKLAAVNANISNNKVEIRHQKEKISDILEFVRDTEEKGKRHEIRVSTEITRSKERISKLENTITLKDAEAASYEPVIKEQDSIKKREKAVSTDIAKLKSKIKASMKQKEFYEKDRCGTCEQPIQKDFKAFKLEECDVEISYLVDRLADAESRAKGVSAELEGVKTALQKYLAATDSVRKMRSDLKALEKYLTRLLSDLEEAEQASKVDVVSQAKKAERQKAILDEMEVGLRVLMAKKKYYILAGKMLADGGIKTKIVKSYVPTINALINKHLREMDFHVGFTLDESLDERITSRFRDEFQYNSFSEGEKVRIDLALLFTWREIAQMRNSTNTNLLVFDEITDRSLETEAVSGFIRMLYNLPERVNSFVISHNDSMRDRFQRNMVVKKEGNFSSLHEELQ